MARVTLDLDAETTRLLMRVAINECRNLPGQAEVIVRDYLAAYAAGTGTQTTIRQAARVRLAAPAGAGATT
jgi:hypothetical protein